MSTEKQINRKARFDFFILLYNIQLSEAGEPLLFHLKK
jgi:hypothetical protein